MASISVGAQQSSGRQQTVRKSPLAESDWDTTLDNMLEDLETSRGGGIGGFGQTSSTASSFQQSSHQRRQVLQQSSYKASSARSQSASSSQRSGFNPYPISKSKSSSSINDEAGNMLKDLEGSLKASSNYIQSQHTVQGPTTTREYHEYRSYTSNGTSGGDGDFNLERQVQHMMPQDSFKAGHHQFNNNNTSGLQSANMVSNMQQQKQTYTSYKVQSNQYNSSGERIDPQDLERPGSRLKQNIDELDTLLYDLNNARKISDAGADYTASSITPGNMSSDDYSFSEGHQGHVKKTIHSYDYQGRDYASKKPPSPSPKRRGPQPLSSPTSVRRASPGPSSRRGMGDQSSSSSYKYTSSYQKEFTSDLGDSTSYSRSYSPSRPITTTTNTTYYPTPEIPKVDGTPTGVSYYTKYHSTHTHQSQGGGPASFPSNSLPRSTTPRTQTTPKRVDELMTELSEFDSSIQHTSFTEPAPEPVRPVYRDPSPKRYRDPSPPRVVVPVNPPAPTVYCPPGEMYPSAKSKSEVQTSYEAGSRGRAKGEYMYKSKEKSKHSESEGKQGAAVVPICLPLCCAAPCVIM